MKITPQNITELKENEIFVFGSNLLGNHIGGAAKTALQWGAVPGNPSGIQGNTYALPTIGENMQTLPMPYLTNWVNIFIQCVKTTPNKHFLLTEVGCGIAGLKPEDVAPLFAQCVGLENISMPQKFLNILSPVKPIRGYKVTLEDGTAKHGSKNIVYKVGEEYMHNGPIQICGAGFHFCTKISHCFSYYEFNPKNKVFEVEAIGKHEAHGEDSKICTDHLRILREIPWSEVLEIVNDGCNNTGHGNTGGRNTGGRNTGDSNTGDSNTGGWNTGGRNTGYSNTGDRNTGGFCTGNAPFPMFNKKSSWTEQDFLNSKAYYLLSNNVDTKMWVSVSYMTEEEKLAHPSYKTADGYLKDIPFKEAFQNAWHNWDSESRKAFTDLPNFDAKIFKEITSVDVKAK